MQTNWNCEKCKKQGLIEMDKSQDAWGAYIMVKEEHHKVSPECEFDRYKVRVSVSQEQNGSNPSLAKGRGTGNVGVESCKSGINTAVGGSNPPSRTSVANENKEYVPLGDVFTNVKVVNEPTKEKK